ncbi:Uncharacterised protein [Brucella suis]|nr:Uncharacterised protein [Brucella suis]
MCQDAVKFRAFSGHHDAVGGGVGKIAHFARTVHAHGKAPRIFDQEIADRRRQRPKLADLERLDGLEALDHGRQHLQRKIAVGMGDIEPGQREDARHSFILFERNLVERKLADEAARQVAAGLLDVLVDLVMVVEQPLRGRRDGFARARGRIGRTIGMKDQLAVFRKALIERKRQIARQRNIFPTRDGGCQNAQFFLGLVMSADGRGLFGRNLLRSLVFGGRIGQRRRQFGHLP